MGPETQGFLKNCWYVAAWDYELVDRKLMPRTILEQPLVIFKGDSGKVAALDNRCAHRGAKTYDAADAADKRVKFWQSDWMKKSESQRAELTLNAEDGR